MSSKQIIRIGVCGSTGRMGREVVKAVLQETDLKLVMAVDRHHQQEDAALAAGLTQAVGVLIEDDLKKALEKAKPDVVVDFTAPHSVKQNSLAILETGARAVIGTTGLSANDMKDLEKAADKYKTAALVAPNFALGAVLLMKFAQEASRYFDHAELIELHHNQKLDAPSGTALRTAELMSAAQPKFAPTNVKDTETIAGARGAETSSALRIHSVRLPGLVAHQEVIFGSQGQTLTIRHDSLDRTSFMPGVVMACRAIADKTGFYYGLETLI